jgi:hypothetical protein
MQNSKRIKRVFSTADEVCHLWAAQAQSDARCRNVFFEGTSVYSYGRHYELGRLISWNGQTVALINTRGYSVTTDKHIYSAKSAVRHLTTIDMPEGISADRKAIRAALLSRQDDLLKELFGHFNARRVWCGYLSEYGPAGAVRKFNETVRAVGFPELALDVNQEFIDLYDEHAKYRDGINDAERAAKRERQEQERREQAERAQGVLAEWKRGGPREHCLNYIEPQQLRIKDDTVETTGGASVPLSHALKLLRLIDAGKAKKGQRIGHYEFDSIAKGIVRIGCHEIDLSEARSVLSAVPPKLTLVGGA